jgi:5-methylcytosine-specific restriction endonuclease McrA
VAKEKTYSEKLKDPRWQKKRLEILQRDNWQCYYCGDTKTTLHVHHEMYLGSNPWDTPDACLTTLCEDCHSIDHIQYTELEKQLLETVRLNNLKDFEMIRMMNRVIKRIKGIKVVELSVNEKPF